MHPRLALKKQTISAPSEREQAKELKEAVRQPSDPSQDAAATSSGQTERSGQLSHDLSGSGQLCLSPSKAYFILFFIFCDLLLRLLLLLLLLLPLLLPLFAPCCCHREDSG